jgi:hypothetical protein
MSAFLLPALSFGAIHSVNKSWDDQARRSPPKLVPAESGAIPADVMALVVLWRLRYKLILRDLAVPPSR